MKWKDITKRHNGRKAVVSEKIEFDKSTWRNIYHGVILRKRFGRTALRISKTDIRYFPGHYEVELVNEETVHNS